ncbi:Slp family lipoprotein [Thalassotalea castellviae]|uniref:Slp family lipoprotein n=1 Tax=Thalassotalea castellviae TaxID=3075612 RepID=A0ABU3A0F4_9GAMM|nr:Slp family lipoprotein [Thalassotalea sp. W431]MDT0602446.1 Slp family lipoprotein [Thalassotalea sp. W431]
MLKKLLVLLSLTIFVSGCVHIPESVRVEDNVALTSFIDVRDNNSAHLGNDARWGGVIAKIENNAENTMLEVVHFQLSSSTRPLQKDQTQGRFKVYYQGFLDPIIYKEGRSITAIGKVAKTEAGKIGEHEYDYPVLKASKIHLWKEIKKIDVKITHQPMWYTPSLWYNPRPRHYSPIFYPVNKNVKKASSTKKSN